MADPAGRGPAPDGHVSRPRGQVSEFTTYREGSLHAALKTRYAATIPDARIEAVVDGFVIDVAGPDELVEIQTASFGSASRKLDRLVGPYRVVLVHTIPIERWLVLVDADGRQRVGFPHADLTPEALGHDLTRLAAL